MFLNTNFVKPTKINTLIVHIYCHFFWSSAWWKSSLSCYTQIRSWPSSLYPKLIGVSSFFAFDRRHLVFFRFEDADYSCQDFVYKNLNFLQMFYLFSPKHRGMWQPKHIALCFLPWHCVRSFNLALYFLFFASLFVFMCLSFYISLRAAPSLDSKCFFFLD